MAYVEEREFTFRLELVREFGEDYQGDADGYAWAEELRPLTGEMLHALIQVATRHGWSVQPRNRGRSSEDEVTLVLSRREEEPESG